MASKKLTPFKMLAGEYKCLYSCIQKEYTVFTMTQTTVITTRIKKEVKEVLEKAGVNIPKSVRQYLEELAWKLQLREETEKLRKLLENVKPSEKGFSEKSVREDRESH